MSPLVIIINSICLCFRQYDRGTGACAGAGGMRIPATHWPPSRSTTRPRSCRTWVRLCRRGLPAGGETTRSHYSGTGNRSSPGAVAHARHHCRTRAAGQDSFERAIRRGARAACRVENGVIHGRPAAGIAWCPLRQGTCWRRRRASFRCARRRAPKAVGHAGHLPGEDAGKKSVRGHADGCLRLAAFADAGGERASLPPDGGEGIGSRRRPAGHGGRRERLRPSRGRVRRGSFRRA